MGRKAVKTRRRTAKKGHAQRRGAAMTESIAQGEFKLSELETLQLQKLYHQNGAAMEKLSRLEGELTEARTRASKSAVLFNQTLLKIKGEHGLEVFHDVILDDERSGVVIVNQKLREQHEAILAQEKVGADEAPGSAEPRPEPAEEPGSGDEKDGTPEQV